MNTRWIALIPIAATLAGCVERKITVTSEPPGALVTLNDQQIGRTPVETEFLFHGDYDVRLELDGYEPVHESRKAKAPVYEWPGIDLVAAALPLRFKNEQAWHFDLTPSPEARVESGEMSQEAFERDLLNRAHELRDQTGASADQ